MKKLFLILAFCTSLAHAETWFEATNAGGGKIVLLLQKCAGQEGFVVIAQLPNGSHSTGCWTYVADLVIVLWDGGTIKSSTFNANAFVMRER
jgi:hypothetical protein